MLFLVVALPPEGKPLRRRFGLVADADSGPFPIFRHPEEHEGIPNVALVQTGLGKVASAAGTAYLAARFGAPRDGVWLNVGVAGGGNRALGDVVVAHKVRDVAREHDHYPAFARTAPCATGELRTVERPTTDYDGDVLFDMEAAGFYATACRFSSAELVHTIKVISDGPGSSLEDVTPSRVEALIEAAFPMIDGFARDLVELSRELRILAADPHVLAGLSVRFHLSVTETRRLRRLLQRLHALSGPEDLVSTVAATSRDGTDFLRRLESAVDALPPGGSR